MSLILIVTQTTFVLSIEAQTLYGFIFLGSFSLIVTINLLVIIYLSIATLLRRKRRLLDAMWRAVYEKGWLCCCGKMVVRKSKWVAGKEKETKEVEVEAEV